MSVVNIANREVFHHYTILDKYTAGVSLIGPEVKSIRAGKASFNDSFCVILKDECLLKSFYIAPYAFGTSANVNPTRDRKLLLTKKEILKIQNKIKEKGLTLVPLRMFTNNKNLIKIEIAIAKGKKLYDKRESIKSRDVERMLKRTLG